MARSGNLLLALAASLSVLAGPAFAADESSWPATIYGHFAVHHAAPMLRAGYAANLERIYGGLIREFRQLHGGMSVDKVDFYLYPDKASYLAGKFRPPPWSDGVAVEQDALGGTRVFATHERASFPIVAHELTHLFFHAYYHEAKHRLPPAWLDEGLAVMMQVGGPRGRWLPRRRMPMREFMGYVPPHEGGAEVAAWYEQAGSVVSYLHQAGLLSRFPRFCDALRDGADVERALIAVYGFRGVDGFERSWLAWAANGARPRPAAEPGPAVAAPAGDAPAAPGEIEWNNPLVR